MRIYFIISIAILSVGLLFPSRMAAQPPDSIAKYFPLQVGNRWNYTNWKWDSGPDTTYRWSDEIVDTLNLAGRLYYQFGRHINLSPPRYDTLRMDSVGRVWEYHSDGEIVRYDFTLPDSGVYSYGSEYTVVVERDSYMANMIGVDSSIYFFFDRPYATDSYHDHLFVPDLGLIWESGAWSAARILESAVLGGRLVTSLPSAGILPTEYSLLQNYPNPFNPSTLIIFNIPRASYVKLRLFNVLGEEISILMDQYLPKGKYTSSWNGDGYPGGVYFYRIEADDFHETKKMVLVR